MAEVHTIEARTHGRYLVEAPPAGGPWPWIVGFHGYGENAAVHLEALRAVVGGRPWLMVSVQGLNRFYTRQDGIVAGWMTREDREHAIADNIAYVSAVLEAVTRRYPVRRPLVLAGFSQGVAMAYRTAAAVEGCDGIVALAGDVPPDVVPTAARLPPVLIGRGTGDAWYTEAKAEADLQILRRSGVATAVEVFEAGHVWTPEFSVRAGAWLDALG
ncbi:MAG: acetylxylan esterase [Acidobacteriota bacterium]